MLSDDPRMNPQSANVMGSAELDQPYARRTIKTFIGFGIALLLLGAFVGWSIFSEEDETEEAVVAQTENGVSQQTLAVQNEEMPGNDYEDGTGRSAVYNFFYKIFGGIEEGLDESPQNLKNVEHIDDMNLDAGNNPMALGGGSIAAGGVKPTPQPTQRQTAIARTQATASQQRVIYENAFSNIVGRQVFGNKGENAGEIYDIVINQNTGQAQAVIIDNDESDDEQLLTAINFQQVLKQSPDGDITLTLSQETVEQEADFNYASLQDSGYVSLRNLQDGQLLDFEGKVAGQIDGIIYENAEVQNIYFTLRPILAQQNARNTTTIQLPYDEAKIVKSADGYDVKLTKEQTENLAKSLFTE